jgi:hypothetical protein
MFKYAVQTTNKIADSNADVSARSHRIVRDFLAR